jgi:hypothetical protein
MATKLVVWIVRVSGVESLPAVAVPPTIRL